MKTANPTNSTPSATRKRRMRRSKTLNRNLNPNPPNSSPSSGRSALNQNTERKKHRARPFEPLPEFVALAPAELEAIHDLLRHATLAEVDQHLQTTHNIHLSTSTLHRYRARLDLAEQLELAQDSAAAIENLLHLFAGRAVDLSTAGRNLVLQRSLHLAAAPGTAPTLLVQLHRLFTYEDRREAIKHRMKIADQREKSHARLAKVAERRQLISEKKYKDQKAKRKATIAEKQAAVRELFGELPPITTWPQSPEIITGGISATPNSTSRDSINETTATDAELTSAKLDAGNPPANSSLITHDSSLITSEETQHSAPSTQNFEDDLADRVDTYTVRRVQEYIAHNQKYTPWPHRHSPPEYTTQYRTCPCGNSTPCPIHEAEELFPPIFWKLSPLSLDYEIVLRDHNLPYRRPTEYMP